MGTHVHRLVAERMYHRLVVAALLNRRVVSLDTPLVSDCELVPLTTEHWEGQRVYRRSLALLALGGLLSLTARRQARSGAVDRVRSAPDLDR